MDKRTCAIVTNDNHTDIVLITYSNQTLLIITQFKKFGTFLTVTRESSVKDTSSYRDEFEIKVHFGSDTDDVHVAANYIANNIGIADRSLLISIALKKYNTCVLRDIVAAINKIKPW